jgi:predicted kinase
MPTAFILCGPPGCGKTTFRDKFLKIPTLSTDNYLLYIAKQLNISYNEAFKRYITEATKVYNEDFTVYARGTTTFCIDRTNVTEKSRAKSLCRIPKEYNKVAIYFEEDIVTCMDRVLDRTEQPIDQSILSQFWHSYVRPTKEEGFDLIISAKDAELLLKDIV